jgi:SAM-dependent methyltransferase
MYRRNPDRFAGAPSHFVEWAMARFPSTGRPLRLLELGCGVGRDSRVLAASHEVWAVDHSSVAIARARRAARGMTHLHFEARDALDAVTRREDASIDVVYAHALYMGFQETELDQLLGEIHRVLRPRGLHFFAVRSTTDPHYGEGTEIAPDVWYGGSHETPMHYYRRESLERFTRAGFERVEETLREELHLWFVCDRRP